MVLRYVCSSQVFFKTLHFWMYYHLIRKTAKSPLLTPKTFRERSILRKGVFFFQNPSLFGYELSEWTLINISLCALFYTKTCYNSRCASLEFLENIIIPPQWVCGLLIVLLCQSCTVWRIFTFSSSRDSGSPLNHPVSLS